jgi:hypothetical protein
MQVIEFIKPNGERGSKKVHDFGMVNTLASFRRAGYTIIEQDTAVVETAEIVTTEQTGRVGKGREIHRIVGGGADCGSSYRRGLNANSIVKVTGEEVTCSKCRAI